MRFDYFVFDVSSKSTDAGLLLARSGLLFGWSGLLLERFGLLLGRSGLFLERFGFYFGGSLICFGQGLVHVGRQLDCVWGFKLYCNGGKQRFAIDKA